MDYTEIPARTLDEEGGRGRRWLPDTAEWGSRHVVFRHLPPMLNTTTTDGRGFMASPLWPKSRHPSSVTLGELHWPSLALASAVADGPHWPSGLRPATLPPPRAVAAVLAAAGVSVERARSGDHGQLGCWALAVLATAWSAEMGLAHPLDPATVPMGLGGLGLEFFAPFGPSAAEATHSLETFATILLVRGDWVSLDELAVAFVQHTRLRTGPRAWFAL